MKNTLQFCIALLLVSITPLSAVSNTFLDYQNYNHGYCPSCNCYPCNCGADGVYPNGEYPPEEPYPGELPTEDPSCPPPDPCDPAPVCGGVCGISLCTLGLAVGGTAAVAAILIRNNNGRNPAHSHTAPAS